MLTNAKWIRPQAPLDGAALSFECTFRLDGPALRATLCASALGVYEPSLNGVALTDARFLPGWTNYHKRIQFQTFEAKCLREGENTLRLLCAPGWAVGHMGYDGSDKNYGESVRVIAALEIECACGSCRRIVTDESWRVYTSQILFSDIYDGETVDRTAVPRCLGQAVAAEVEGALIPQEGEFVREGERVAEARRFVTPRGERVVDFGQNLAGYVSVCARGERGERIVMRHAETLDENGNFYTENLRQAKCVNTYVLSGGPERFQPKFTWQGFRYICLDEFPQGAFEDAEFTAVAVHSDLRRTGRFVCGHEGVNRLYQNLVWSQRANFIDVPTDCPQRDERMGWLGDAQVFCQTAALNYDVDRFFRKWLKDVASEQREDGAVWGVSPTVMKKRVTRISAAWGDAAVICPWILYLTYGDRRVLEDQFDSMCRWIGYLRDHTEGGRALWLGGHHYGDWLAQDNDGEREGKTPKDLIATAFYALSTALTVKAGRALGRDMREYEALYDEIRRAFTRTFTRDGLPVCLTQTACALMLRFGLCEDERLVADTLARMVTENGKRLNTGFVGTPHLLYALSEHGHAGLAYDLLLQEQFPSWLYAVKLGATSMWERWDGANERGELFDPHMNSFNHYAYGAVGEWLYRTVAGIRAVEDAPGYRRVLLCPAPDARLGFAEASVQTAFGEIRSAWHILNGQARYEFSVPEGVRAEIRLPGDKPLCVGEGSYEFTRALAAREQGGAR